MTGHDVQEQKCGNEAAQASITYSSQLSLRNSPPLGRVILDASLQKPEANWLSDISRLQSAGVSMAQFISSSWWESKPWQKKESVPSNLRHTLMR
jgi:hypothetical protein